MSDKQLDDVIENTSVFARVSPADKMRIICSLKRKGEVAAMTGDGVNDSPALKPPISVCLWASPVQI